MDSRFAIRWLSPAAEDASLKTLILVRHAKSSWADTSLADRDRPLNQRGARDAARMAKRLAKQEVPPGLIITSPARRARDTARIFAEHLDYRKKAIVEDERLYPGRLDRLLQLIGAVDSGDRRVMLFGHDPALLRLARRYSSTIARLPTSAVASFAFDVDEWHELDPARLRRVTLEALR